jgi:hypothetical protein
MVGAGLAPALGWYWVADGPTLQRVVLGGRSFNEHGDDHRAHRVRPALGWYWMAAHSTLQSTPMGVTLADTLENLSFCHDGENLSY